jgi:hypothetical protein
MRQKLSIVLIVIAALLVVGTKVVAPKPGLTRSYFTGVKTAVPSSMKICCQSDVRLWPKVDMPKNAIDVAIGGKADMG